MLKFNPVAGTLDYYENDSITPDADATTKGKLKLTNDLGGTADLPTVPGLSAKANASDTVNLTGNQTVAGIKTFSSSPIVPTATTATQAVNKAQMDTADALKVNKAGDTMTGTLTTTGIVQTNPVIGITSGATNNALKLSGGTINDGGTIVLNGSTAGSTGVLRVGSTDIAFWSTARLSPSTNNTIALGSPTQSWSNVYVTQATIGGVLYVTGTGFPEGVVTAPVGSIYIDKAITNGASSWIKKSGTGSTGWQVLEGDTGWREISSLLINGWTAGELLLRRVNAQVYIRTEALSASAMTSANVFTLPAGFKAFSTALSTSSERQFLTTATNPAAVWRATTPSSGVLTIQGSTTGLALLYGTLQFTTPDAWPTTLPGTPA